MNSSFFCEKYPFLMDKNHVLAHFEMCYICKFFSWLVVTVTKADKIISYLSRPGVSVY